jgi:RNA polymerase sigma factor FliA
LIGEKYEAGEAKQPAYSLQAPKSYRPKAPPLWRSLRGLRGLLQVLDSVASESLSREEIIHKYLHLVKYVAGRISVNLPSNVDIDDLINDGVFGLIDAIEKFDDSRAVKFETYAITRINGAIIDALRCLDWVPRTVRRRAREIDRAHEELEFELGRDPTDEELAKRLNMSMSQLDRTRQRVRGTSVVSLEDPLPNVGDHELFVRDTLEDTESDVTSEIERGEQREELVRAVESLTPQERTVIQRFYFNGETLKEIKVELGVSESRVSQIHAQAVTHLRQMLRGD